PSPPCSPPFPTRRSSDLTGMLIVETIAVSTMVCNDLVMPALLRLRGFTARTGGDLTRLLLNIRRAAIVGVLALGYLYFHIAGDAYALVSIGLISFAAVAQFAPALLAAWTGAAAPPAAASAGRPAGSPAGPWARRHPRRRDRRAARRIRGLVLDPDAALAGQVRVDRRRLPGHRAVRHPGAGAGAPVRHDRLRAAHPRPVLEPAGQRRAVRRAVASAPALRARGQPGAAVRGRVRAQRIGRAGVLARPGAAGRPAPAFQPPAWRDARQRGVRRTRPRNRGRRPEPAGGRR